METKEIILPDGWEVKEVKGNKIIVGEKGKKELPKTWEECCNILEYGEYINSSFSVIEDYCTISPDKGDRCVLPTGLGKPMLALCQLLICRNAWWKQLGWRPNWNDTNSKYCISCNNGVVTGQVYNSANAVLAFPTKEVCVQFLESFRDLIEEAKELL